MMTESKPDPRSLCRCCGWSFGDYFPWNEDGMSPEYAICDCCACESGNEDHSPESLDEYRQKWLDSGAKWWDAKTKPVDWENGILLREQLDRLKPKRRFHRISGFSPFGSNVFHTPEEAIAAGKSIDARRKEELKLDIESLRGYTVRKFFWSPTELSLEFHSHLYLVLRSTPDWIVVDVQEENIAEHDEWFDEYEFVSDDQRTRIWSPMYTLQYFQHKVFANIQLEYRMVWLYFQKSAFLIQAVQTGVKELDVPVLTWQEGD